MSQRRGWDPVVIGTCIVCALLGVAVTLGSFLWANFSPKDEPHPPGYGSYEFTQITPSPNPPLADWVKQEAFRAACKVLYNKTPPKISPTLAGVTDVTHMGPNKPGELVVWVGVRTASKAGLVYVLVKRHLDGTWSWKL